MYKRTAETILEKLNPYDDEQGWIRIDDVVLAPVWSCDLVLPNSLIYLIIMKRKKRRRRRKRKSLTLTISVKAMVNDVLTILIVKAMRG